MKFIKLFLLTVYIITVGIAFGQQPPPKKNITETPKQNPIVSAQKNNTIKTVPKSNLKQVQLKNMNQARAKMQSQNLKKAIRKAKIIRKPIKK